MNGEDDLRPTSLRQDARAQGSGEVQQAGRDLFRITYLAPAPSPPTARQCLPRDTAAFTGRDIELRQLLDAAGPNHVAAVHTISGMPGVGKTALVTRAAHLLADRFPDGQFFVALKAHTSGQSAADPADVLTTLLTALGIAPGRIPPSLEGRAALWRDRLADKRALLVLDDAADHAQIEPLLPGTSHCLTLITSRRRLIALDDADFLPLDVLSDAEAVSLFTRLAHRSPTALEQRAVSDIVTWCGCLPLAVVLLAGRLAHHPTWTIEQFAADFAATRHRLADLGAGDRTAAAAFDMSYRDLPAGRQRVFRALGLLPGPETDAHATAALTGLSVSQARHELEALYTDHLLDEPAPGRYRLHHLLRTYALDQARHDRAEDREQATERLLNYYEHAAETADRHFVRMARFWVPPPFRPLAAMPDLTTRERALDWMRQELPNVLACVEHAVLHGQDRHVIRLTAGFAAFLYLEGLWPQAVKLHQAAADAANRTGNRHDEAMAMWQLSVMTYLMGDRLAVEEALARALTLFREANDAQGEAYVLFLLSIVRYEAGDMSGAFPLLGRALTTFGELKDRQGEAYGRLLLGLMRQRTGELRATFRLLEESLTLFGDVGDRLGEAVVILELGHAQALVGDLPLAAELEEQALALTRDLGSRIGEAYALCNLGHIRALAGDPSAAAQLLEQAVAQLRDLGDRRGEAHALGNLGHVRQLAGDHSTATRLLEEALALSQELGNLHEQGEVLLHMGALRAETAGALEALDVYRQALRLARQVRNPLQTARALEGAARCQVGHGGHEPALADLQEAVSIYQRIGAAEAEPAAEYLATLRTHIRGATDT
ncbi:ATP-binding protein [Streptomyces sclerotialus]|uniref:ATP-binding protein n=1 Tax=Streptomyces sclerotialus TaxID=1957 RepID=UPI00068C5EBD